MEEDQLSIIKCEISALEILFFNQGTIHNCKID